MSEILAQLITPQVKFALTVVVVFIALLYLMSIIWVVRDSFLRGTTPVLWGIIALIPFLGVMIYAMMRPPLYACDREEQNISLLLQQRQLMEFGECPQCGYPTRREYVLCPHCLVRLRNICKVCNNTLEPEWSVCPHCATKVGSTAPRTRTTTARNTGSMRRVAAPRTSSLDTMGSSEQETSMMRSAGRVSTRIPSPNDPPRQ